MDKKKPANTLLRRTSSGVPVKEIIPKEIHSAARQSLANLFRDSLYLNDQLDHESEIAKNSVQDDILEDFQIVSEYLIYLELRLKQNGIDIEN